MKTLVKICGITRACDALAAVECGVDALGFVFYNKSPRYISFNAAKEICSLIPKQVIKIGVFVNEDQSKLKSLEKEDFLDYFQFSGDETPEFCSLFRGKVIKALRINSSLYQSEVDQYKSCKYILCDSAEAGYYGGTGKTFEWDILKKIHFPSPLILAGGLDDKNVSSAIREIRPYMIDVSSGVESGPGIKDKKKIEKLISVCKDTYRGINNYKKDVLNNNLKRKTMAGLPNKKGYFGDYGGKFVPETLVEILNELEKKYYAFKRDAEQKKRLKYFLKLYAGRPTPLYFAENLTQKIGGSRIYLKREDLLHTGAHKINNTVGQILLADYLGKYRIIAETGAGQHGVATASVAARFGKKCVVYMGEEDMKRQSVNVFKMKLLGAEIKCVRTGSRTLKDATSEAIRDWVTNAGDSYYLIGSVVGPHPYPKIVRDFQSVIGKETKRQIISEKVPNLIHLIACVGGGSNSVGLFYPFLRDNSIKMIGVEAGGLGLDTGKHAATLSLGRPGVLHGSRSYLLQDENCQVSAVHSISAGLDYPGIGPEHSYLKDMKKVQYISVTDDEAVEAFHLLTRHEGIIPALESSHAIAAAIQICGTLSSDQSVIINLSGRGDKDIDMINEYMNSNKKTADNE